MYDFNSSSVASGRSATDMNMIRLFVESKVVSEAFRAQRAPGARKLLFNQSGGGPFPECLIPVGTNTLKHV